MPHRPGWVVDASVAVKWLVPEEGTGEARLVLDAARAGRIRVHVPEIWLSEIANSLWKKTRRPSGDRIEVAVAARLLAGVRELRVAVHSHDRLVTGAFAVACRWDLTVYDGLYATLALSRGFPLVTADDRLMEQLGAGDVGDPVVALRDVPAFLESAGL